MLLRLIATLLTALALPALALAEPLWIDVRSPDEYHEDHIPGDLNIPHTNIAQRVESVAPARDTEIVLYCAVGGRAGTAKKALEAMGYTHVRNAGGIADARKERGCDRIELAANCSTEANP